MLKTDGSQKWERTLDAELAFRKLKEAFAEATILHHFNGPKPIILQTNAHRFAITSIVNQYDGFWIVRPVTFDSQKCSPAKRNYDRYYRDLLVLAETFKPWRHNLVSANHKVRIQCNHKNLEYFQTSKVLSRRPGGWVGIVFSYNFAIEHLEKKKIPADKPF
jgi:hypothetical protein